MPNFKGLSEEISSIPTAFDAVRDKYLGQLHEHTGRNVIAYYSAWLQRTELIRQGWSGFEIDDSDKNAFMATIHELDREKGLDLILHTPGGDVAATESLVDYLRSMFGNDIRAIVPQLAMSAGTMIACACDDIMLGKHSSLGPIDPQMGGLPATAILEEFEKAKKEVTENPMAAHVWGPIIAKYHPTLIVECANAIAWAEEMVTTWLETGMFREEDDPKKRAKKVVRFLADHKTTATHSRHISVDKAREIGLRVSAMEDDHVLQDLILSVHHAFILTVSHSPTMKVVSNHRGIAMYSSL